MTIKTVCKMSRCHRCDNYVDFLLDTCNVCLDGNGGQRVSVKEKPRFWFYEHEGKGSAVTVRQGFNWAAFIFGWAWLFYNRMFWLGALYFLLFLSANAIGVVLLTFLSIGNVIFLPALALNTGLALILGFSANSWKRTKLEQIGFRRVGAGDEPNQTNAAEFLSEFLPKGNKYIAAS